MLDNYYRTPNIIVGSAEIFFVPRHNGWIIPGGEIIKDVSQAVIYACKLHDLITQQSDKKIKDIK